MAKYKIKHITDYYYGADVYDSINQIMLYPIEDSRQKVLNHTIGITQNPLISRFKDKYGNDLAIFSLLAPHKYLNINSIIEVDIDPFFEPILDDTSSSWEKIDGYKYDFHLKEFLEIEKIQSIEPIKTLVDSLLNREKHPFENAKLLSEYIFNHFEYRQGVTSVETEIDEIWELKAGVCQDFAHFLLVILRLASIPARYVSGYICPQNHELRGEGATHAWVEVYIPNFGWIGLDPTNNCVTSDRHVRLAVGRDFNDCTPVKGIFKGNLNHRLEVTVVVENFDNLVVTKPSYSSNFYENDTKPEPSFVSVSNVETVDNSYFAHQQIQKKIQMQQQQQ